MKRVTPIGVSSHPLRDEMEAKWREGMRAAAISSWLNEVGADPVNQQTLGRYGQRYWTDRDIIDLEGDTSVDELADFVDQVNELVGDVSSVSISSSVSSSGLVSTRRSVSVKPAKKSGLELAAIPNINIRYIRKPKKNSKPEGWKLGVFLPDMQIGYYNCDGGVRTMHDESALDIAHQIMSWLEYNYGIDCVVNAGDNLDFPDFSSHRSSPSHMGHVQASLDRAGTEAAIQRGLAPDAQIFWISGNHEARLEKFLVDKALPLLAIERAGGSDPVLSLPFLCRFDEVGVEFVGPYPQGEVWINDHLRCEHGGSYSSAPGGMAAKHLQNGVSVLFGHSHHFQLLQKTKNTARGPRTFFAGSPGCLCKLTKEVPSTGTGITAKGLYGKQGVEDWQQGLFVFWYQPDGQQLVNIEPVSIWGGWAMFRGEEFFASVDADGQKVG